jgi:hypothetical protein
MGRSTALVTLPCDDRTPAGDAAALLVAQSLLYLCLAERIEGALRATGYPALRVVDVTVADQLVILDGRVPSYYMKQLAQAVAMEVATDRKLRNDLHVVR